MGHGLARSLVFWSGLLVMGFIVWAWWDSTRQVSYVRGRQWEFQSWASGVSVAKVERGDSLALIWFAERRGIPQGEREILGPVNQDPSQDVKAIHVWLGGESLNGRIASRTIELINPSQGYYDPRLGDMRMARAGFIAAVENDEGFVDFVRKVNGPSLDPALQEDTRRILIDNYHTRPVRRLGWVLFIPYWILLLAVALPWGGLLARRDRRRKRHEKMLTTMDAVIP